jgi:hypothetical protein
MVDGRVVSDRPILEAERVRGRVTPVEEDS